MLSGALTADFISLASTQDNEPELRGKENDCQWKEVRGGKGKTIEEINKEQRGKEEEGNSRRTINSSR
jgi:hypothetical protein